MPGFHMVTLAPLKCIFSTFILFSLSYKDNSQVTPNWKYLTHISFTPKHACIVAHGLSRLFVFQQHVPTTSAPTSTQAMWGVDAGTSQGIGVLSKK